MLPINVDAHLGGGSHDALPAAKPEADSGVHFGRTSRSTGARCCAEPDHRVSLSRANLKLDVRRGHLFHSSAGTYNQAARKNPQTCQWRRRKSVVNVKVASRPPDSCFVTAIC